MLSSGTYAQLKSLTFQNNNIDIFVTNKINLLDVLSCVSTGSNTGLHLSGAKNVNAISSTFNGGSFAIYSSTAIKFNSVIFKNSKCLIDQSENIYIRSAIFSNTSIASSSSNVVIEQSEFKNSKGLNGSAISFSKSVIAVTNTTFQDNFADGYGGALYCSQSNGNLFFNNFISNLAMKNGGAFFL